MTTFVPPPEQRFDPITARWLSPGGPLFDPARAELGDGEHMVSLVGPIPGELAHASTGSAPRQLSPTTRMRRAIFVLIALSATVILGFSVIGILG